MAALPAVSQGTYKISPDEMKEVIAQLADFVAIPSVSNPNSPDYKMEHLEAGAEFAASRLAKLGFDVRKVSIDGSAPFVLAEKVVDAAKPTLLLYAHYDVQPVDRSQWTSDPFVMQERDGRLYGRGASDDKGGIVGILTALGAYQKAYGALPCNIKVLFEGEEEYGSTHMEALLHQEGKALKADALVVLDASNVDVNTGTLTSSTRGLVNLKLEVRPQQNQPEKRFTILQGSWGQPNGGNSIQESATCDLRIRLAPGETAEDAAASFESTVRAHPPAIPYLLKVKTLKSEDNAVVCQLIVQSMEKPIHSGVGCLAPDPSIALADILTTLPDVTPNPSLVLAQLMTSLSQPRNIPNFMDDCKSIAPAERALLQKSSQTPEQYVTEHNLLLDQLRGDPDLSVYERISEEPSVSCVNGQMAADSATTQIGVRLTAGQDPERVAQLLNRYLRANPNARDFTVAVSQTKGSHAWSGDLSRPLSQKYLEALADNFPNGHHVQPSGGALPLLTHFEKAFPEMEMLLPGVEDSKSSIHSHDESQDIGLLERSINSLIGFLHRVGGKV